MQLKLQFGLGHISFRWKVDGAGLPSGLGGENQLELPVQLRPHAGRVHTQGSSQGLTPFVK